MKHILFLAFAICVLLALSVERILAGTETCPTTNAYTSTQYINSTLTLKILLVEFSDVRHRTSPSAYTRTDFENLLVSSGSYVSPTSYSTDGDLVYGSLRDYFNKMSNGNLTISGYVVNSVTNNTPNWVMLPYSKSHYHSFLYLYSPIFDHAMNAAMAQGLDVSWSDNIVIIYAGTTYYLNSSLSPPQPGGLNPMAAGTQYIMGERHSDPGDPGEVEVPGAKFSRIGPHCHEFAHIIGIPHSSGSRADIMDAGRRNGPDNRGAAPAPLNPIARMIKGWLSPTLISGQEERDAYYSQASPQIFRINSNSNNDYFLVENRRFNQNMVIGSTSVPDYSNVAFFPAAWSHGTITQGLLVWRVLNGYPSDYANNGLIYASGIYGLSYPEHIPSETDDGVPFPGVSQTRVLSPWSDSRAPTPNVPPNSGIFVPNTLSGNNVAIEVLAEDPGAGYFRIKLYSTNPVDASPSKPRSVAAAFTTSAYQTAVSWAANQEPDVVSGGGYNLYREFYYGTTTVSETKVNGALLTSTSYTDNYGIPWGIPSGVEFYVRYKVEAVDYPTAKVSVKGIGNSLYLGRTLSGTVTADLTTTTNYLVSDNLTIAPGKTVTAGPGTTFRIAPGRTVSVQSNAALNVLGTLYAVGTPTQHITIDGQAQVPQALIRFAAGGGGSMSNADFKRAPYQVFLDGNSGPVSITNCSFSDWGFGPGFDCAIQALVPSGPLTIENSTFTGGIAGIGTSTYGILCAVTSGNVTISGNTVTKCLFGIYLTASQALLQNNTVEHCTVHGIFSQYATMASRYQGNHVHYSATGIGLVSSHPIMQQNRISYNTGPGMLLSESSPQFGYDYMNDPGYNVLRGNASAGIQADNYSYPFLGYNAYPDVYAAHNSIYDTDNGPAVRLTNCSWAYAHLNYWGNSWFDIDGSSYFDPDFPLGYDPNNGEYWRTTDSPALASGGSAPQEAPAKPTPDQAAYKTTWTLITSRKYGEARTAIAEFLNKFPDSRYACAVLHLYQTSVENQAAGALDASVEMSLRTTAIEFLTGLSRYPGNAALHPMAMRMLSREYTLSRKSEDKLTLNDYIMKAFPSTVEAKAAAFDNLEHHLVRMHNPVAARPYFDFIESRYPGDFLLNGIEGTFKSLDGSSRTLGEQPQKVVGRVTASGLDAPYPNPFNPETAIRLWVQERSSVKLVVYDMLGREVAVLIDGSADIGAQTARWDASKAPSGVYLVKLTTVGESGRCLTASRRVTLMK